MVGMRRAGTSNPSELATPVAFIFAPMVFANNCDRAIAGAELRQSSLTANHFHRGDLWVNAVQLGLLAVDHPFLWLLHHTIQKVREDCCDDVLLARDLTSGDAYCDALHTAREFGGRADRRCVGFMKIFIRDAA
jgi:hypothetical protein